MTIADPPAPARTGRHDLGIIVLILTSFVVVPTTIGGLAHELLVPEIVPPEAVLLIGLPGFVFLFTWWLLGPLILVGLTLVLGRPRRRGPLVFGGVVAASWATSMALLALSGALTGEGA